MRIFTEPSTYAEKIFFIAENYCLNNITCYPNWRKVQELSKISDDIFMESFDELCEVGLVYDGFPSVLIHMVDEYPLAPMFGPLNKAPNNGRPSAEVWKKIRTSIFLRDDYTCSYCGEKGGRLECDHIVPVCAGGGHTSDNLTTSCFSCNRSKGRQSITSWRKK